MKTTRFSVKDKNNRLGRGLDALLGPSPKTDQILLIDIEKIQPNKKQARKVFDKQSLEELAHSIKQNGVLQAILVEKKGDIYQIIAGERRWRAVCMAGLKQIPALVKTSKLEQKSLWTLIENIQREDLSPIEEARAFKQLMDEKDITQESLAKKLSRSRSSVANTLRLLQLDPQVQKLVEEKKISFAQARELLRFQSPKEQRAMAKKCIQQSWTVKKLNAKTSKKQSPPPFWAKKSLSHLEKKFSQRLKLDYRRGHLIFSFKDEIELKNLLNQLW